MHACRDRCRSAILGTIVIGPLRIGRRGASREIGHNHVGEDGPRFGEVEGDEGRVHGGLPEILAPAQEFCIDRANLVERLSQPVEVANQMGNVLASGIRDVISAGPPARLTDDEISLRTVSRSARAVAVRPTAALVGPGQRTA